MLILFAYQSFICLHGMEFLMVRYCKHYTCWNILPDGNQFTLTRYITVNYTLLAIIPVYIYIYIYIYISYFRITFFIEIVFTLVNIFSCSSSTPSAFEVNHCNPSLFSYSFYCIFLLNPSSFLYSHFHDLFYFPFLCYRKIYLSLLRILADINRYNRYCIELSYLWNSKIGFQIIFFAITCISVRYFSMLYFHLRWTRRLSSGSPSSDKHLFRLYLNRLIPFICVYNFLIKSFQ